MLEKMQVILATQLLMVDNARSSLFPLSLSSSLTALYKSVYLFIYPEAMGRCPREESVLATRLAQKKYSKQIGIVLTINLN